MCACALVQYVIIHMYMCNHSRADVEAYTVCIRNAIYIYIPGKYVHVHVRVHVYLLAVT